MKALIKTEPGLTDLQLVDIPVPECGDDDVILKVRAVGICGSDIHLYKWDAQVPLPLVMGHEFCGDIVELGKNVKGFKKGDFVVSNLGGTCGTCQPCTDGNSYLCLHKKSPGIYSFGAYAEYVKTHGNMLYKAPEGVPEEVLACFEPFCIVLHALKRIGIREGDTVAVAGVGLIGLLTVLMAKQLFKAKTVIAIGIDSDESVKLPMARQLGADYTVNAQRSDVAEEILKCCKPGFKADVVIDCSGAPSSIEAMFKAVKRNGVFGAIGLPGKSVEIPVNWHDIVIGSLKIIASYSHEPADWEDAIKLVGDGILDFSACITNIIKLEDWATIFKNTGDPAYIKGVIKPYLK